VALLRRLWMKAYWLLIGLEEGVVFNVLMMARTSQSQSLRV
jgi:hypothetical protein